jgi:hypothetical protein
MNQKEFELIAEVIVNNFSGWGQDSVRTTLVNDFADELAKNYPKTFNRDKFLKACGL